MHVRQLEHDADARFSQRQRERLSGFSQEANQPLEDQRESLTEVTSEVWRRDEQVHDALSELCLQALHSKDVTQHPEDAGLHRHWPGLVQEAQQHREMFEDSRGAQSSRWTRKMIDFDREKQNFCNMYDVTMMTERNLMLQK